LPSTFQRPAPLAAELPSFALEAAGRLERFVPPFEFTSFFAPEDTLLCVIAAERAVGAGRGRIDRSPTGPAPYFVELTAGSGLVGLRLLDLVPDATLLGVDVDRAAPPVARQNAEVLGLGGRARFERMSVWDDACVARLGERPVDLLVCNPPYVPEPPGQRLAVEAGAGADGAAHLRRVAELAARWRPRAVALSWCSLGDPVGVAAAMEDAGYTLDALDAVVIADGEYSGSVQAYLESLPTAFLNSGAETRHALASDGAARFGYVLLAGVWGECGLRTADCGLRSAVPAGSAVPHVDALMRGFAAEGIGALAGASMPFEYHAWLLDRWDEIALRAMLHGTPSAARSPQSAVAP
jgi:hypothetical protein